MKELRTSLFGEVVRDQREAFRSEASYYTQQLAVMNLALGISFLFSGRSGDLRLALPHKLGDHDRISGRTWL